MQISDALGMQIFAPGMSVKPVEKGSDVPLFSLERASSPMEIDLGAGARRGAWSGTGLALLEDQGLVEPFDFAALAAEMPQMVAEPQSMAATGLEISVGKSPGDVPPVRRTILGADYSADWVVEVPKLVALKIKEEVLNADVLPTPAPTIKEPQAVLSVKMDPLAGVTDKNNHRLVAPEPKSEPPHLQHSLKPEAATPVTAGAQPTTSPLRTDDFAQPQQQIGSLSQPVPKDTVTDGMAIAVPRDLEGSRSKPEGPKPDKAQFKAQQTDVAEPGLKPAARENDVTGVDRIAPQVVENRKTIPPASFSQPIEPMARPKQAKSDSGVENTEERAVPKESPAPVLVVRDFASKSAVLQAEPKMAPNQGFAIGLSEATPEAIPNTDREKIHLTEGVTADPRITMTAERATAAVQEPLVKASAAIPESRLDGAIGQGLGSPTAMPDIDQPLSVSVMHPSRQADTARDIAVQIREATGESRQIDIRLNPEELGKVKISINPNEMGGMVSIVVERPETLDLMRRHLDQLVREFKTAGWTDVDLNLSQGQSGNSGNAQNGSGQQDPQNRSGLRGPMFENVAVPDRPIQNPTLLSADERLDLRI